MAASNYWAANEPAAEWFTSVPFGMDPQGMAAWYYQGDGLKLWEETYAPFNLVPRPARGSRPQMGGWFRKKINTIGDYKGLKMRIAGARRPGHREGGGHGGPHAGRGDLCRVRAGRDRRLRMGRAARRPEAGSAEHRAVLLLPRLARARNRERVRLQPESVRGAAGRPAADPRPGRGGDPGRRAQEPREERHRPRADQDRVQGQGGDSSSSRCRSCAISRRWRPTSSRSTREEPAWPGRCTLRTRSSRR